MLTLSVLSYNVRSLRDGREGVAQVIRETAPDLVCVQEAPRFLRWRSRCAALARRSGMVVAGGGGGDAHGNLLLCQLGIEIERTAQIPLTHRARTHHRAASVAVCSARGQRFALVGTHLDLAAPDRLRHVHELFPKLHEVIGADLPLILGADVNETPGEQAWAVMGSRLRDTFATAGAGSAETFPAAAPRRAIDGIFADRRFRITSCRVVDHALVPTASDHRPVLATLELGR